MAVFKFFRFDLLASITVSIWLSATGAGLAQDSVDPLLDRLRAIQDNPNASAVELKSATIILDRIVQSFPASEAAVSILLEEPHAGIDFKSFAARLAANLAAPAQPAVEPPLAPVQPLVPAQPLATLQPLVPAQPLAPLQPVVQSAQHLNCVVSFFQAQGQTPLQVRIETDQTGAIQALPELMDQPSPGLLMRVDYLSLALALERCGPYSGLPNPGKHLFSVSGVGGLSVTSMPDTPVAAAPANTTGLSLIAAPDPQSLPGFGISSAETEAALDLDRSAIRDMQARLSVIGFDPNGIDGALGKGARSALSAWQASIGVEANGFLNAPQLASLKQQTEEQLAAWLLDPANAAKYNATSTKKKRKKRRVRVCKRNAIGVLYDCKYRWR